jgi:hypothetical protein
LRQQWENLSVKLYRGYDRADGPPVGIAHDYLTQRGGAAPKYTLLLDPPNSYPEFADRNALPARPGGAA